MKLELLYLPTTDLAASLDLFRSLGFTEVWREGDTTASIELAGSGVQIMLDASDPAAVPGPMLTVDSVTEFHAARPAGLSVVEEPAEIPGGFLASYDEPGGARLYLIDQSTDQE